MLLIPNYILEKEFKKVSKNLSLDDLKKIAIKVKKGLFIKINSMEIGSIVKCKSTGIYLVTMKMCFFPSSLTHQLTGGLSLNC